MVIVVAQAEFSKAFQATHVAKWPHIQSLHEINFAHRSHRFTCELLWQYIAETDTSKLSITYLQFFSAKSAYKANHLVSKRPDGLHSTTSQILHSLFLSAERVRQFISPNYGVHFVFDRLLYQCAVMFYMPR